MKHVGPAHRLALPGALAALLADTPALAVHDTIGVGGGAPVHVLIVLGLAVVVALALLSRWQPQRRGRKRAGTRPPKPARKGKRR